MSIFCSNGIKSCKQDLLDAFLERLEEHLFTHHPESAVLSTTGEKYEEFSRDLVNDIGGVIDYHVEIAESVALDYANDAEANAECSLENLSVDVLKEDCPDLVEEIETKTKIDSEPQCPHCLEGNVNFREEVTGNPPLGGTVGHCRLCRNTYELVICGTFA